MFFFTVVREFPKWVVPQMAPKVAGSDKMIVAKTNVLQFDPAKRRVCAALDDADGSNDEELLVISPETLSVAEWKTLRTWRSDQSLTYSIGFLCLQVLPSRPCKSSYRIWCERKL